MSIHSIRQAIRGRVTAVGTLVLLLALGGCGLEEVSIPADLIGPAGLGVNLKISVTPDVLLADGRSAAVVTVTVRDQNGQPRSGVTIILAIADETFSFIDLGKLDAETLTTGGDGVARTRYTAPPRTDATADQLILIVARPVSDDAGGQIYRTAAIELRSAEPKLFPNDPTNVAPVCRVITEPPTNTVKVNESILFQDTSSDVDGTIVRYFWDFADGDTDDAPDVEHHYTTPGIYQVRHFVTDDDGALGTCAAVPVTVTN